MQFIHQSRAGQTIEQRYIEEEMCVVMLDTDCDSDIIFARHLSWARLEQENIDVCCGGVSCIMFQFPVAR